MLAATRRWFRRNRTTFAVGAGAVGLVYLAGQYAWSKWLEAQQRMAEERIAKENLRRRFEQNQEDCTYTVLALLPTVRDEIIGALPVEELSSELQRQKAERLARSVGGVSDVASSDFPSGPPSTIDDDKASLSSFQTGSFVHASQLGESGKLPAKKRTKVQLWNDMKIQSITRALSLLYTLSLLTLLTRIQLNLLGRRTYLSSVVSLASPPTKQQASVISLENNDDDNYDNVYGNDFETNRQYLTFSWWLLHRGCKDITEKVAAAVNEVFGPVNPREDITLERLSELILEIRKRIEGATELERREHKWLPFLLPPKEEEDAILRETGASGPPESPAPQMDSNDPMEEQQSSSKRVDLNPSLRRLLDETSDLIDSPTFTHVLTLLLNSCFAHLIDQRIGSEAFKVTATDPASRITDITDRKCKVAQTLAVFCRQAHVIAAGSGEVDELSVVAGHVPNEYLAAIDQVKDLEGFAAVIYSSNFEFEAVENEEVLEQMEEKGDEIEQLTEQVSVLLEEEASRDEAAETEHGLGDSEVVVDNVIEGETVPGAEAEVEIKTEAEAEEAGASAGVETLGGAALESAWEKALKKEDGVKPEESV